MTMGVMLLNITRRQHEANELLTACQAEEFLKRCGISKSY